MDFLSKIRISDFLIQDKDLTEWTVKKKKAHTKTAPVYAVKNSKALDIKEIYKGIFDSGLVLVNSTVDQFTLIAVNLN